MTKWRFIILVICYGIFLYLGVMMWVFTPEPDPGVFTVVEVDSLQPNVEFYSIVGYGSSGDTLSYGFYGTRNLWNLGDTLHFMNERKFKNVRDETQHYLTIKKFGEIK